MTNNTNLATTLVEATFAAARVTYVAKAMTLKKLFFGGRSSWVTYGDMRVAVSDYRSALNALRLASIPEAPRVAFYAARQADQAVRSQAKEVAFTRCLEDETADDLVHGEDATAEVQSAFALIEDRCLPGRRPYDGAALDAQILAEREATHKSGYLDFKEAVEETRRVSPGELNTSRVRKERMLVANDFLAALGILGAGKRGIPGAVVTLTPHKHAYKAVFDVKGKLAAHLAAALKHVSNAVYTNTADVTCFLSGLKVDAALKSLATPVVLEDPNAAAAARDAETANRVAAMQAVRRIYARECALPLFEETEAERKPSRWADWGTRVLDDEFVEETQDHWLASASWDAYPNAM